MAEQVEREIIRNIFRNWPRYDRRENEDKIMEVASGEPGGANAQNISVVFNRLYNSGQLVTNKERDLEEEKAKTEGARTTFEFLKWLLAHGIVFKQCQENSDALASYLKETNLDWNLPNAVTAYNELVNRGHRFLVDKLAPPAVAKKELPPLPEVPGMGKPEINTLFDVNDMDRERYKRLYFGPHAAEFRARVAEIIRRAKEEE